MSETLPKTFICPTCGKSWQQGEKGAHHCVPSFSVKVPDSTMRYMDAEVVSAEFAQKLAHDLAWQQASALSWQATADAFQRDWNKAVEESAKLKAEKEVEIERGKQWCSDFIAMRKERDKATTQATGAIAILRDLMATVSSMFSQFGEELDSQRYRRVLDEIGRAQNFIDTGEVTDKCPACGSYDTGKRHRDGDFRLPETDWKQCDSCNHQWDHQ